MTSPARSSFRKALVGLTALTILISSGPARAAEGETLLRDTEIEAILRKDAEPIMKAAGIDPKSVQILLIGSKDLNAFAGPGTMGVFTGLIMESKTPNELQGVIGHEVGHLAAGHSARSGEMSAAGMRPFLLTMGLSLLAALAGSGEAAAALAGSSTYFGTLGALGYSREQEGRADMAGAALLQSAGISGKGLRDFFQNFVFLEAFQNAKDYAYFRSHPISQARISSLDARVQKSPFYDKLDTPEALAEHEIMKAKLRGFMTPTIAIVKCSDKVQDYPTRYACAIAQYQMKEPDKAIRLIDALLVEQPDNPYLWELKGQILFEFARAAEAEAPQRRSVALMPDAPLLRINLGQTLIALTDRKKIDEGIVELRKALTQEQDNIVAWRLLAQAYDTIGEDGLARLATAEYNSYLGDSRQALVFAMRAREMLTKDSPEWRRATDIVLTSKPSKEDLQDLAREGSIRRGSLN
jgi:predicted Zn-dependent protease